MLTSFSKKTAFLKTVAVFVAAQFVIGSISPFKAYANADKLRPTAVKNDDPKVTDIKESFIRKLLGDYKVAQTVDNLPFGIYIKKIMVIRGWGDPGPELQT